MPEPQNSNQTPKITSDALAAEKKPQETKKIATDKEQVQDIFATKENTAELETVTEEDTKTQLEKLLPDFQTSDTTATNAKHPITEPKQELSYSRKTAFGLVFLSRLWAGLTKLIFLRLVPLLVVLALLAAGIGFLLTPENKPLPKADAIIVVTGGGRERIDHAVALFKQSQAPYLMIVGANQDGSQTFMVEEAKKQGVPADKLIIEDQSTDTHENAVFSEKMCEQHNFRKLILVSSSYHQLRLFMSFQGAFRLTPTEFYNSPAPVDFWDWKWWWINQQGLDVTLSELQKIVYYWQQGYF